MEEIILVDEHDNQIGTEEKQKAHEEAKLHRCFSTFIFNDKNQLLIQQRSESKYHCPDIWANTCCGHPRPNENTKEAAERRLNEELNIETDLKEKFTFTYKAEFDNGLTEHEFDHVFTGTYNQDPTPNAEEVQNFKWISLEELEKGIHTHPEKYSEWLKIIIKEHRQKLL